MRLIKFNHLFWLSKVGSRVIHALLAIADSAAALTNTQVPDEWRHLAVLSLSVVNVHVHQFFHQIHDEETGTC